MNDPVKISVVVPVYGVERYMERFAVSLFSQDYPYVSYIFVNDGTRDRSMDILKEVMERFPHVRDCVLIIDKQNGGLPSARRAGRAAVIGDYVWNVDPDDWIEDGALRNIAEFAAGNGMPDIIYFDFFKEYPDHSKIKIERDYAVDDKKHYIRNMFNHRSFGCVWNKCVRRDLYLDDHISFPEYSYAEDTYLTVQLVARAQSICHLRRPLYHYSKNNPHSITRQNTARRHREYVLNFMDLYKRIRNSPDPDNPLAVISGPILRRARWYNLIHNLGLKIRK